MRAGQYSRTPYPERHNMHTVSPLDTAHGRMKAWVVRPPFGIEALATEARPVPTPRAHEVLVRMRAVSLNYRDLHVVRGVWRSPAPRVPASDGVGVVVAAGAAVTRHRVGDRVAGTFLPGWLDGELTLEAASGSPGGTAVDGLLAEYVLLDEQAAVAVPVHLSDAEAATLPCAALTAWHALVERGGVGAGEVVLVQGTGGVSLFALQFARMLGARVLATASSEAKRRRLLALGASWVVDRSASPDWDDAVLDATNGRGVDHVVDVAGGTELDRSLKAVRLGGTVSLVGMVAGERAEVNTFAIAARRLRVHGILVGSRTMFERMNAFVSEHELRPVVDRVFPFADTPGALRYVTRGGHVGKVCVSF